MRVVVSDVSTEAAMIKVLKAIDGVAKYRPTPGTTFTLEELKTAQEAVKQVTISDTIRKLMANVRNKLAYRLVNGKKKEGIAISSRRLGALQDAMRASAWLDGRTEVSINDFGVLAFGLWNDRADHEHVKATLDSLDQVLVSALIDKIDKARTEYKQLTDSDFGTSRVTQVTELFALTVAEVKKVCAEPVFTKGGENKIKKAMGKLVKDFKEMNQRELAFCEDV
jgi:MoxR-like ATPase